MQEDFESIRRNEYSNFTFYASVGMSSVLMSADLLVTLSDSLLLSLALLGLSFPAIREYFFSTVTKMLVAVKKIKKTSFLNVDICLN